MKKIITTLTIIAMLICSINIGAVCAESTDNIEDNILKNNVETAEYEVKKLETGEYVALNILKRDLEVYITDGYNPVSDAEVTIAGITALTNENGVASFESIPTSDDSYDLSVLSNKYGSRDTSILLLPSKLLNDANETIETTKCTISFWTPNPNQEEKIGNMPEPILEDIIGTWEYVSGAPQNVQLVESYAGYIYVMGISENKAFDIAEKEWITLSNNIISIATYYQSPYLFLDGNLYRYFSTYDADGEDSEGNEYYKSSSYILEYNLDDGTIREAYYGKYDGEYFDSAVESNGFLFFAGGRSLEEDTGGTDDNYYIDRFSPVFDEFKTVGNVLNNDIITTVVDCDTDDYIYYFEEAFRDSEPQICQRLNSGSNVIDTVYYYNDYAKSDAAGCAIENKIYFAGGTDQMNTLAIFDFEANIWNVNDNMPTARKNAAIEYRNNRIYVLGGLNSNEINTYSIDTYNTLTATWSKKIYNSNLNISNKQTAVYNNRLYASNNGILGIYNMPLPDIAYSEPQTIYFDSDVTLVNARRAQTLAICGNKIYGWGEGYYADGTDSMCTIAYPQLISDGTIIKNPIQVSRGKNHNIALEADGTVWGWGSNSNYPMGAGAGKFKTLTKIDSISNVKQVAAGTEFTIFLKKDGTLWGVGKNDVGQLGQGMTSNYISTPVQITSKTDFTEVSVGEDYVAAVASDGLYTWGGNMKGQLGNGKCGSRQDDPDYDPIPDLVSGTLPIGETYMKVSAGINFCLALTNLNNVYAWGNNDSGQLGKGNKTNTYEPTKVINISDIKNIAAGRNSALVIDKNGNVYGWGEGRNGQLGLPDVTGSILSPQEIVSLNNKGIDQITCGDDFSIAIKAGTRYGYAFGNNSNGSLGIVRNY